MNYQHVPVLHRETIESLAIKPDGIYCDCTLGGGGHTKLILDHLSPTGKLIAIDRDAEAVENAKRTINDPRLHIYQDNYTNLDMVAEAAGVEAFDGIMMDLGVSSHQLDSAERGFSYRFDAKLDMRMDNRADLDAYKVVNTYSDSDLVRILRDYGEEKYAGRIANRIVRERENAPIETTGQLADLIAAAVPAKYRYEGGSPAKRSFQAIRIEVNGELEGVSEGIRKAVDLLKPGGRIAVISFHSLEDRIVKTLFNKYVSPCTCPRDFPICICGKKPELQLIGKKSITASKDELEQNSRAHSAKLRAAEKI